MSPRTESQYDTLPEWWSAGKCLYLVTLALGSKQKALELLKELLVSERICSSYKIIYSQPDAGPLTRSIPDKRRLDVTFFRDYTQPGVAIIGPAFWCEFFNLNEDLQLELWEEDVFSISNGSEPILRQDRRSPNVSGSTSLFRYQVRTVAHEVYIDFKVLSDYLDKKGLSYRNIVPIAQEPADRRQPNRRSKGTRYDWRKIQHIEEKALSGRLYELIGPVSSRTARRELENLIIKTLNCEHCDEPSRPTLYRKTKRLLEDNESAQRAKK